MSEAESHDDFFFLEEDNQIKIIEDRSQGLTIRDIATKHKLSIGKVHYLINTL